MTHEPGPVPSPSQAKCSLCRQTFGGVTLFDRHRKGGECVDPRAIGLRRNERGVWKGEPDGRFPVTRDAVDALTAPGVGVA